MFPSPLPLSSLFLYNTPPKKQCSNTYPASGSSGPYDKYRFLGSRRLQRFRKVKCRKVMNLKEESNENQMVIPGRLWLNSHVADLVHVRGEEFEEPYVSLVAAGIDVLSVHVDSLNRKEKIRSKQRKV